MSDAPGWYWDPSDPEETSPDGISSTEVESSSGGDTPESKGSSGQAESSELIETASSAESAQSYDTSSATESSEKSIGLHPDAKGRRGRSIRDRSRRTKVALAAVLIALIAAYLVLEIGGRVMIGRIVQTQIRNYGVAGDVQVRIGRGWWSPSVSRLVATGRLDRAQIELESAELYVVPVETARYRLDDLDVALSIRHRSLKVDSLGSGKVLLVVDPKSVAELLGVKVSAHGGILWVGESTTPASVHVEGANLAVESPDIVAINGTDRALFPLVDPYLMPCQPNAKVVGSFIELRCTGNSLPGILGRTIGLGTGQPAGDPNVPPEIAPPQSTIVESPETQPSEIPTSDTQPSETAPSATAPGGTEAPGAETSVSGATIEPGSGGG